jgi:hypothetical protein
VLEIERRCRAFGATHEWFGMFPDRGPLRGRPWLVLPLAIRDVLSVSDDVYFVPVFARDGVKRRPK